MNKRTQFNDIQGKAIYLDDTVQVDGNTFTVTMNDFNGKIIIDGDTGQEELEKICHACEVILPASEILSRILTLRSKAIYQFGMNPNVISIGHELLKIVELHFASQGMAGIQKMFGMDIQRSTEPRHLAVGFMIK